MFANNHNRFHSVAHPSTNEFSGFKEVLAANRGTRRFGKRSFVFNRLGSTNSYAKRLAAKGSAEGTLVIAEKQTRGRGRRGRRWESAPGKGLWISLILRPDLEADKAGLLALLAGLSVAQTVETHLNLSAELKWPNDVLIQSKKFCGILSEAEISARQRLAWIVLGIGLNVNHLLEDFSDEIRPRATSLAIECGSPVSRSELLLAFLGVLEENYLKLKQGGAAYFLQQWIRRCPTFKKRILLRQDETEMEGIFEDLDAGGRMLLRLANGEIRRISAGEVIIQPE
ncbi:MAG: biotin--[acetyl-CoA-carboxylase] ligase [bacterium]